jgi:uncharacterized protein (TIGR02646 family)
MRRVWPRTPDVEMQRAFAAWSSGPAPTAHAAVCGAEDAQRKAIMKAHEAVYKQLREYLLWLFHNKCAYCEADYRSARVQVEHFRPKSRVTGEKDHPGYYWLMFDAHNLLPSCSLCNNKKRNRFPVSGRRAAAPDDDLTLEEPGLLNPYDDNDIDSHLEFVTDEEDEKLFGVAQKVGNSWKGHESIIGYGLNDDAKVRARQLEMKAFLREFKDAFEDTERRAKLWRSLQDGSRQFSAACEAKVSAWIESVYQERKKYRT